MELGHGYSTWLGAESKFGALPPLKRAWWTRAVEGKLKGPRGETPLHWAISQGDAARSKMWLGCAGGIEDDAFGCRPLHWLASGGTPDDMRRLFSQHGMREAMSGEWGRQDGRGRDPLGYAILRREPPLVAAVLEFGGCSMAMCGPKMALSVCDALVASEMRLGGEVGLAIEGLLERMDLPGPSNRLPSCLAGGVWTQDLWEAAVVNFKTRSMLAREEAAAIGVSIAEPDGGAQAAGSKRI